MAAAGFRAAALALAGAACTSIAADERTFEDTRWRVTAINGRATPAGTNGYRMEFRKGQVEGALGCNQFGGSYRVEREIIRFTALTSTLLACVGGPGMDFEREGMRVLQQPVRLHWQSGPRLTLSNSAGWIELEPLP